MAPLIKPVTKAPSERPGVCFYCGNRFAQLKNLKRHHNLKHKGRVFRLKTYQLLDNFFAPSHRPSSPSSINANVDPNSTEQILMNEISEEITPPVTVINNTQFIGPLHAPIEQSTDNISASSETLDLKLKKLKHDIISELVQELKPSMVHNKKSVLADLNDIKIRNASTILQLQLFTSFKLYYKNDECVELKCPSALYCELCYGKSGNMKVGYFNYNFEYGTDFTNIPQHMSFRNLKSKIISHLNSETHISNKSLKKDEQLVKSRNRIVGINLARSAYKAVVTHCSQQEYEIEVATDQCKGVDIGDKNHSRKFSAEMTEYFYTALQQQFMKVMRLPVPGSQLSVPFSIIADKLTPTRGTLQVVGVVTYLNGELTPLLVDLMPISQHTGEAIAKSLYDSLIKHFTPDEIKARCVGGAFDGQYFKLGVPKKFAKLLKMSKEQSEWFSWTWDPAHLIELAEKKVKKTNKWAEKTQDLISKCNHEVGLGKGYAYLLQQAKNNNMKAYSPISFSITRFATYSYLVMKNFLSNYTLIYDKLTKKNLVKCKSAEFILKVSGMCDIYNIINRLSLEVQQPSIYPWQVYEYVNRAFYRMERLIVRIKTVCGIELEPVQEVVNANTDLNECQILKFIIELFETDVSETTIIKNFEECATSLIKNGKYKEKNIAINSASHNLRSVASSSEAKSYKEKVQSVGHELIKLANSFQTLISKRLNDHKRKVVTVSEDIFSLKKILERQDGEFPEQFEYYCTKAKLVNFISDDFSIDTLKVEYNTFCNVVKHKAKTEMEEGRDVKEVIFYNQLINSSLDLKDCQNICHLFTSSIIRTHCEAVAEGMGSVVSHHSSKRPNLSKDKLFYEVFLSWNGPPPTGAADKLLEKSLNLKYGENWNFVNKTRADLLQKFCTSKVVDRVNKKRGKIPF